MLTGSAQRVVVGARDGGSVAERPPDAERDAERRGDHQGADATDRRRRRVSLR